MLLVLLPRKRARLLGDRFGRRRMFLVGLVVFTGASAAAALSPTVGWLVTARAVQGAGGALIMPLSEVALTGLGGTIEGGPFAKPLSLFASSVSESFTGAPSCGVSPKKGKAKPVKSGSFSTTQVEIGK